MKVTLNLDTNIGHHFLVTKGKKHLQATKKKLKNVNPLSYIDLLILTLTQHEKTLSQIIGKLEEISQKLDEISDHLSDKIKNLDN